MTPNVTLPAARAANRPTWANAGVLQVVFALATLLFSALFVHWMKRPPAIPDLGAPGQSELAGLSAAWARGDMVVLVRHVERCDRAKTACIGEKEGITWQGSEVAQEIGVALGRLGMDNTDVFASPLARTQQTALFMFDQPAEPMDWLYNCRQTILKDLLAQKVAGRNLVVVTHSECIDSFEQAIHTHQVQPAGYGGALFVSLVGAHSWPHIIGYLQGQDWPRFKPQSSIEEPLSAQAGLQPERAP